MIARALTIAGSDPGGGAGLQQDLKTFQACGVWGMAAVTALTVQDTARVHAWEPVEGALVAKQIAAVARDIGVDAAKTGMLPDASVIEAVARALTDHGIASVVVDPVLVATSGDALARDTAAALREVLVPRALLVTPNAAEATSLTGVDASDEHGRGEAARALVALGATAALVTGGDADGPEVVDAFCHDDEVTLLRGPRIEGGPFHGSGCMLSAAIVASLARGEGAADAVRAGRAFVARGIAGALRLGNGARAVNPGLDL